MDKNYIDWDVARKAAERERTKYLVKVAHEVAVKAKEALVSRIIYTR